MTIGLQSIVILIDLQHAAVRWQEGQVACWPKSIFIANAVVWALLMALAHFHVVVGDVFAGHCGAMSQGLLAIFALASVAFRRPFPLEFSDEWLPRGIGCEADATPVEAELTRSAILSASSVAGLLWAAAFTLSAALQEVGFNAFTKKSLGEIVLCHLLPPLCIVSAAREADTLSCRLTGRATEPSAPLGALLVPFRQDTGEVELEGRGPVDGTGLVVAVVDGVLLEDFDDDRTEEETESQHAMKCELCPREA
mmetsp:Transcript_35913/g.78317  ORF Transcript_35913/g.78317 Transcript_35913/m.78317 type:complete len:253 (+) Transcript_35913:2-760(+)